MSFDSFLAKVKSYGRVFLAGFLAAAGSFLVRYVIDGNVDIDFIQDKHFYYEGLIGGLLYLLIDIVDDFARSISFMNSLYNQMTPIYYSLVAPLLLAAVLGIAIPLYNAFFKPKLLRKLNIQNLFSGFESKYKDVITYFMVRMCFDSLAHMVQYKYFSSYSRNENLLFYTLVSAGGAFAACFAYIFLDKNFISGGHFSTDSAIKQGTQEAIVEGPYALISALIADKYKYLPFSAYLF